MGNFHYYLLPSLYTDHQKIETLVPIMDPFVFQRALSLKWSIQVYSIYRIRMFYTEYVLGRIILVFCYIFPKQALRDEAKRWVALKVYLLCLCSIGSTGSNLHTPPAGLLSTLSFNTAFAAEFIEHYKIIQTESEGAKVRERSHGWVSSLSSQKTRPMPSSLNRAGMKSGHFITDESQNKHCDLIGLWKDCLGPIRGHRWDKGWVLLSSQQDNITPKHVWCLATEAIEFGGLVWPC